MSLDNEVVGQVRHAGLVALGRVDLVADVLGEREL
jgi:hypothetical protein